MDAPVLNATVVMAVPELGVFRARVVSALEGRIVLVPLQRPPAPLRLLSYDATLGRVGAGDDGGRLVGTITRRGERWVFESSPHQRPQQREAVRVEVAVPVQVSTATDTLPDAETVDLSDTGALIRLPTAAGVGGALELEFHLPDGRPPLRARCRVVRAPGPDLVAVRFERLEDTAHRRLARFLFARQWAASRPSVDGRRRSPARVPS